MSCNEHLEHPSPFMVDPEALKVREWRHKLQKAFLHTYATPKEDVSTLQESRPSTTAHPRGQDMPALDRLFALVETYDNMTTEYLTVSVAPLLCHSPPPCFAGNTWHAAPPRGSRPHLAVCCAPVWQRG